MIQRLPEGECGVQTSVSTEYGIVATYNKDDPTLYNEERPNMVSYLKKETQGSGNCS